MRYRQTFLEKHLMRSYVRIKVGLKDKREPMLLYLTISKSHSQLRLGIAKLTLYLTCWCAKRIVQVPNRARNMLPRIQYKIVDITPDPHSAIPQNHAAVRIVLVQQWVSYRVLRGSKVRKFKIPEARIGNAAIYPGQSWCWCC